MSTDGIKLPITRRDVLRGALAGGVLLSTGGVLAACGSDSGDGSAAKSNTGGTPATSTKPGGSLRVGVSGGGAKDSIDAHVLTTDPDIARSFQLYEPLAIRNPAYELEMLLAESIEADKSPDSWTIRLRDGVTFHNGKPVTAEDVLFSLARITDPKAPKTGAASIEYIDLKRSKKLDARTVRVALESPNVGFPDDLGQYFNGIVPADYDPKNPVGTGPFKFKSFTPGERSVLEKNPDYWRKGEPKLDEVVIIDFADDTARVNALLGGQVDAITNLPAAQIAQVKANTALNVLIAETGARQPFVELLGRLRDEMGLSLLFITHDLALIRTIADRVSVMTGGRIVEQGPVEAIFEAPAADYTRLLLANTPSIEVALGRAAAPRA